MNLIASISMPFMLMNTASETSVVKHSDLEYCNERTEFCVQYIDDVCPEVALIDDCFVDLRDRS